MQDEKPHALTHNNGFPEAVRKKQAVTCILLLLFITTPLPEHVKAPKAFWPNKHEKMADGRKWWQKKTIWSI